MKALSGVDRILSVFCSFLRSISCRVFTEFHKGHTKFQGHSHWEDSRSSQA